MNVATGFAIFTPNRMETTCFELPSGTAIEGDEDAGIDGWVSTRGGRIWYIDTTDMITRQNCGIGCLVADPNFLRGENGIIEQSYCYTELVFKRDE